jgi:hypothetical protein
VTGSATPSIAATSPAHGPAALMTAPARISPLSVRAMKAAPLRSSASSGVARRRSAPCADAARAMAGVPGRGSGGPRGRRRDGAHRRAR